MQIGKIIKIEQFPRIKPFKMPKPIPEQAPQKIENWPVREKESVPLTPQRKEQYAE